MDRSDIKKIVNQMTLEEKAMMCSGADFWHTQKISRLNIPQTMVSDGPHGLRKQPEDSGGDHLGLNDAIDAVCFPAACATACSFDRELLYEMGEALGRECQAENVSVLLGPAVNIKRSPLCGRNFEYLSEDPYAAGELAAAYIRGVQSQDVGTSIKHFAANNQEHERMSISADADERTLREIYFPAFETAVKKAHPWTVMCSYNRINGIYASENKWLLTDVLRDEWGFDGYVMSDWGAVRDRVEGIIAGMDLEMPGSNGVNDKSIVNAVKEGRLKEEILDLTVERILNIVYRYTENRKEEVFDRDSDHKKAAAIAKQCMVLLKNEEKVLPLSSKETIAFIGGFAEKPRYQGGGSSHINSHKVVSALDLKDSYGDIIYAQGFSSEEDNMDLELMDEAVKTAQLADKIVVFAGLPDLFESESYDRSHMNLPKCQTHLIEKLSAMNKPVIVVLHNGSPIEMPWADNVQGILEAYLGGEAAGEAVMDILYGNANPSGKLAETFPLRLEDNPSYLNFPGMNKHVNYAEGIFVGYRYYDTKKMDVRFPFGYGLSYTTFDYSNLRLDKAELSPEDTVTVSVDITNTGDRAGKEIVQLYVSDKTGAAIRPIQELKNFAAVTLNPQETKTVSMELDYRSFAWYDASQKDWYAATGNYEIRIGKSSREIVLSATVSMKNNNEKLPVIDENVMIGDLMNCKKTASYVQERLMPYIKVFTGGNVEGETTEMEQKMVYYMPLSSLRSFGHLDNEELFKIVNELKSIIPSS
ncbi:glycosyl hydrolase [Clostridium sp. chh4-2]|uniref:glycoside hydrolase family 3 C-terminal domain-containing protein n=1 Tax=Clostridium sp. chh4-2 TaxID=2067550 RepID=UPI000CCEDD65|nr:glycoside hydrolase family 3 C-terminal domain-containing protein [Clostridium sp. chh4-2]PNV59431.1 glycosyl hydrolase [Clostridium sp. chh4-2]